MNQDSFKLTSYFGERQRTDGGFAADALLDLYGRHRDRDEHPAARRRGVRGQAPAAHRPVADAVGGPAADRGRGRQPAPHQGGPGTDRPPPQRRAGHPGAGAAAERRHGNSRAARRGARGDQADDLPRPPGAGVPGPGVRGRLRPAAPPRRGWRDRDARRRWHRARPAGAGVLLQPQRGHADDGHRGRLRRADRPGAARARRATAPPAADARARPHLQARRGAALHAVGAAGHRRDRHAAVAQAHGLHVRGRPARRPADPPRDRARAARRRDRRRDHPAG